MVLEILSTQYDANFQLWHVGGMRGTRRISKICVLEVLLRVPLEARGTAQTRDIHQLLISSGANQHDLFLSSDPRQLRGLLMGKGKYFPFPLLIILPL